MHPIEAFVHNPVKVCVGVLLVVLFGFIGLARMPMQLTPEVQIPTITVETRWRGASPQEVEREIIQEQEEQLKSVEGLTKMTSESRDSIGRITMEFMVGIDIQEALLKAGSQLQQVREYPENADEPVISTSDVNDRAIAWFILSARLPTDEQLISFQERHPEMSEAIGRVWTAHNEGVALLRLRELAADHPQAAELLPVDIDVTKFRRFAEDYIEARFERVRGVSNSNVIGGLEDEMQVVVDPERLAARRLTINDVRQTLRTQNKNTSGGDLWEGKRRYVVRTMNQFRSEEQVGRQLLAIRDGAPVYIRDVAEVRLGYKKPDGLIRRFGASNIAVNVLRETGANVLDVMVGLRAANRELNEGVLFRRGLQLTQVYDETDYINSAVALVQQNIYIGGALTMIILMLFLELGLRTLVVSPLIAVTALAAVFVSPWFFLLTLALILTAGFWFARGALVAGLAIPVSIVGTFLMLNLMGRSLNVISLAGLAFAVGMLVDNAVIVLENIYRHYQRGEQPFSAAVSASKEVWGAVIASTLTTLAVFLPVLFVQQEAGQLFRDIALAISSAVGLSLIVSITLIPMAAARLFRTTQEGQTPDRRDAPRTHDDGNGEPDGHDKSATVPPGTVSPGTVSPGTVPTAASPSMPEDAGGWWQRLIWQLEALGRRFVGHVVGVNRWAQQGLTRRLTVVGVLVGTSVLVSYALWPKVEYLPTGNRNLVFGIILPPPGYNIDQLMRLGEIIEEELQPYWNLDAEAIEADEMDFPPVRDFFYVARDRRVFLGIRAVDPTRAGELIGLLLRVQKKMPGTIVMARQSSLFSRGLTAGRNIDIEITGPELTKLVRLGGEIMRDVATVVPGAQAFPRPSLDLSSPEVHLVPKLVQASEMGVNATDLGYTVDALVDGAYATDYFIGGDKIDLTIIGKETFARHTQDLEALPVATPLGQLVPMSALADVQLSSGPEQVNHTERQRAITIQVSPPPQIALQDAIDRVKREIIEPLQARGELTGGYMINLSGTADKLRQTWDALFWNVLLALAITYLLMAALFESWLYPLVIIFSVPLGAVGGILGLRALNLFVLQPLDVLTMLGFVILIGTVVNNAILIVHQSLNHMRLEGMSPHEAILESVRTRIRPIFMTTSTTVLGLSPLVLFPGAGSELYRGLGSVVLGGLVVSTIFTLVLVPTLFSLMMDAREHLARKFRSRQPVPVAAEPPAPQPVSLPRRSG